MRGETKAESSILDRLKARSKAKSLTLQAMSEAGFDHWDKLKFRVLFQRGTDRLLNRLRDERLRKEKEREGERT